jgi:hypothetical protein
VTVATGDGPVSGEIQRPHRADILRRSLRARAQPVRVRVRGRNRDHLERAVDK